MKIDRQSETLDLGMLHNPALFSIKSIAAVKGDEIVPQDQIVQVPFWFTSTPFPDRSAHRLDADHLELRAQVRFDLLDQLVQISSIGIAVFELVGLDILFPRSALAQLGN